MKSTQTTCCIAGGGPAGMMLGVLLARAGVRTLVLEKHKDFLRDFRGDTVHPSTLEVMWELGLLRQFLARPHQELPRIRGQVGATQIAVADFTHLPTHCRFVALMPQWDFLSFLAERGSHYPGFQLLMEAEVTGLIEQSGRVAGAQVHTVHGPMQVHADLVIGADGRHSRVRESARLQVEDLGSPIDVLWLRLPREPADAPQVLGYFTGGRVFVTLDRGDYWQCAFVIRKGGFDELQRRGIEAFRAQIARIVPAFQGRVAQLRRWEDVKLLTVKVDRLRQWWRPGLLCIGDSAHAMSPIGGVGINLAIQDAVASANMLAAPLLRRAVTDGSLAAVQRRRMFPTRVTQRFQVIIQDRVISRVLDADQPVGLPWPLRLLDRSPWLQRIPARAIGMGVRPEHVRTRDHPALTCAP
jgi:2-polyprenyl-6-methoxyphenol hydroxylase-like FAD-dependent oxidoreductase